MTLLMIISIIRMTSGMKGLFVWAAWRATNRYTINNMVVISYKLKQP